jgi:hypothetical protein
MIGQMIRNGKVVEVELHPAMCTCEWCEAVRLLDEADRRSWSVNPAIINAAIAQTPGQIRVKISLGGDNGQ